MGKLKDFLKKYLPASSRTVNGRLDFLELKLNEIISYQEKLNGNNALQRETSVQLCTELKSEIDMINEKLLKVENMLLSNRVNEETIKKDILNNMAKVCEKRTSGRDNTNLVKQSWELAGLSTAKYVNENMAKAKVFQDPVRLREYAVSLIEIDGLYLEFGVYSGTSINQIADLKPQQTIYGFDSFKGLPEPWRTGFDKNKFALEKLPVVRNNVELIVGYFEETLPTFMENCVEKCSYVHIDCDLYSSTKTVFDILKNSIVKGTIIVFDEYFNYPSWQKNEFKAFQEYVKNNYVEYEYLGYVPDWEQVAVRISAINVI